MKKFNYLFLIFVISSLFISCATNLETVKRDSVDQLKEDEGFILFRIINPNAGKVIDKFYYSNGDVVKNQKPLHLNSDLEIKRAPGSWTSLIVANTESPEQFVLLKAKKGSYGILKVGEYSEYLDTYIFKVEAGVVNYAGDIKLDIVTGNVLFWNKAKDYYDLSVLDNFDEILELRESSALLALYSDYEFVNQSKKIETMKPLFCSVIRDN